MSPNKVVDENELPKIISSLQGLSGYETEIGIFGSEAEETTVGTSSISMLDLAVILHEGCQIRVTPKMRNYLAFKGLHLKKDTKFINIPARPFIDPATEKAETSVMELLERAISGAIDRQQLPGGSGSAVWNRVGLVVTRMIQNEMVALRDPPNHPFTIAMKGSDNPLIDHGHLLRSVIHEVRAR